MQKVLSSFLMMMIVVGVSAQHPSQKFEKIITPQYLQTHLSVIASDEMEGRETATEGQRKAAAYIVEQFKRIGLKPGNGNSYEQFFPVYQDSLVSASLKIYNHNFALPTHFNVPSSIRTNQKLKISELVFAGFGLTDSVTNDFAGLDVKDKWVLFIEGRQRDISDPTIYRWFGPASTFSKLAAIKKAGARGALVITRNLPAQSFNKTPMYVHQSTDDFVYFPITMEAAASLLTIPVNTFSDLQYIPRKRYTTDLAVSIAKTKQVLQSSNVIGVLEGGAKKDEYVVLSAHYDHLGKHNGKIYYGADDDGSGTTAVIAMAEAFAEAARKGNRPERSIIFVAVSGEEKGLWGSEYYTANPTCSLEKTSANLNIDMVGRIDPAYKGDSLNYVYVIGDDKLSSDLRPLTDSIKNVVAMEVDRRFNDVNDPNRFYFRSDHYNFAKNGVPVIFYFNGTHPDYHKPSDTVEKIQFELMAKRVRMVFLTAWAIANRGTMLIRDIPLQPLQR